jgi:hypothetical protein
VRILLHDLLLVSSLDMMMEHMKVRVRLLVLMSQIVPIIFKP